MVQIFLLNKLCELTSWLKELIFPSFNDSLLTEMCVLASVLAVSLQVTFLL